MSSRLKRAGSSGVFIASGLPSIGYSMATTVKPFSLAKP